MYDIYHWLGHGLPTKEIIVSDNFNANNHKHDQNHSTTSHPCTNQSENNDENTTTNQVRLRIWSQNVWLISPVISSPFYLRFKKMLQLLSCNKYDIICFQEAFSKYYTNEFKKYILNPNNNCQLKYFHHFCYGSSLPPQSTGILIFSRYEITDVYYHKYFVNGYAHRLHHGDYHASKGVGLVRIKIDINSYGTNGIFNHNHNPNINDESSRKRKNKSDISVDIYCTHLHACYTDHWAPKPSTDHYYGQRVAQAYDLASFVNATRKSDIVLICGDFNAPPNDIVPRIPQILCNCKDVITIDKSKNKSIFLTENIPTYHSAFNTFTNGFIPNNSETIKNDFAKYIEQIKNDDKTAVGCDDDDDDTPNSINNMTALRSDFDLKYMQKCMNDLGSARLDYIFVSTNDNCDKYNITVGVENTRLVREYTDKKDDKWYGKQYSISDHEGIYTELTIDIDIGSKSQNSIRNDEESTSLKSIANLESNKRIKMEINCLNDIYNCLETGLKRCQLERNYRFKKFLVLFVLMLSIWYFDIKFLYSKEYVDSLIFYGFVTTIERIAWGFILFWLFQVYTQYASEYNGFKDVMAQVKVDLRSIKKC